ALSWAAAYPGRGRPSMATPLAQTEYAADRVLANSADVRNTRTSHPAAGASFGTCTKTRTGISRTARSLATDPAKFAPAAAFRAGLFSPAAADTPAPSARSRPGLPGGSGFVGAVTARVTCSRSDADRFRTVTVPHRLPGSKTPFTSTSSPRALLAFAVALA